MMYYAIHSRNDSSVNSITAIDKVKFIVVTASTHAAKGCWYYLNLLEYQWSYYQFAYKTAIVTITIITEITLLAMPVDCSCSGSILLESISFDQIHTSVESIHLEDYYSFQYQDYDYECFKHYY